MPVKPNHILSIVFFSLLVATIFWGMLATEIFAAAIISNPMMYNFEDQRYFPQPSSGTNLVASNIIAQPDSAIYYEGVTSEKFGFDLNGVDTSKTTYFESVVKPTSDRWIAFNFWVKSSDFSMIKFRIVDKNNEYFDIRINHNISGTEWQHIVLPMDWPTCDTSLIPNFYARGISGGDNNKIIDYPLKSISFVVDLALIPSNLRNGIRTFWVDNLVGTVSQEVPAVSSVTPVSDTTGASGCSMQVNFDKVMDTSTFNGIQVIGTKGDVKYNINAISSTQCRITFNEGLSQSDDYVLFIPDSVKDTVGIAVSKSKTYRFTTAGLNSTDTAVGYRRDIKDGCVEDLSKLKSGTVISYTNVTNMGIQGGMPVSLISARYHGNTLKNIQISSDTIDYGQSKEVSISLQIQDVPSCDDYLKTFLWTSINGMVPIDDASVLGVAPTVSNIVPQQNATNIEVNTSINITFNGGMDTSSFKYITVQKGDQPVYCAITSTQNDICTITFPNGNLDYLTQYTVTIPTSVKDQAGIALEKEENYNFTTKATVATVIQQEKFGNVFLGGEPIKFDILSGQSSYNWLVYDCNDQLISSGTGNIINNKNILTLSALEKGYYTLKIIAERQLTNSFAVLSNFDTSQISDSPFGFSTHFRSPDNGWIPKSMDLLSLSGAKNFRDEISWGSVEKIAGIYSIPNEVETFMNRAKQFKLNPLIILDYVNANYDNGATPYTESGWTGYANYGKALLNHYGDLMKSTEVYNEYNGSWGDLGGGPADSKPESYYPMLKKTYETEKAIRPNIKVVGPATIGVARTFIEDLAKLGGMNYLDAISVHPYDYPSTPEWILNYIPPLNDLIKQYNNGVLKPVWVTEDGWPTHQGDDGITEKVQSSFIVRIHVLLLSCNVEKIFWYDFLNDGLTVTKREHNFGIIRHEGDPMGSYAPKPAYVTYAVMTRQLTGTSYVSQDNVGTEIYSYRFKKGSEDLRVIWSRYEWLGYQPQNIVLKTSNPVEVTNMMGKESTYTPVNGNINLAITGDPIYVKGTINSIVTQ